GSGSSVGPFWAASLTNTSEPHRSPGQDRWLSSGIPQAGPLAAQADTVRQLRYRAVAGPARIPDPARGRERAAAVPSWSGPGRALRLLRPWGRAFQRSRALLGVMLAVAVTGGEYGTARELLGLEPFRLGKLGNFTALLRQHGILEPVTAAICQ